MAAVELKAERSIADAAAFVHRGTASKVICKAGALAEVGSELAPLGIRRPLLLAGARTARSAIHAQVAAALSNIECRFFSGIPAHSSVSTIEAIVAAARAHDADGFVAIGGGSVSDSAKAAALLLAEGGALTDHASRFMPPSTLVIPDLVAPKLPIVAIPTTASGAEATASLGVRTDDARKKLLFWDPKLASRLIVIDPEANVEMPASVMLSTGMNGLAHCIEGLYSRVRTPITTALALHAITLFRDVLPAVAHAPRSVEGRAALLTAAHLSGLVLTNARTCLHHAICHALGAVTGVPHGQANAVMLPHALAFNAPSAPEAMAAMVRAWGGAARGDVAAAAIGLVRDLQAEIGVSTRLRDIGVPREALAAVAQATMGERGVYFNPRPVERPEQIESLLQAAW